MAWFRLHAPRYSRNARPNRPVPYRPFLDLLEDRLAPAVFTVINNGDTGVGAGPAGDLRYCITQANATSGLNTIQFAIPGAGVQTIRLTSALPSITNPLFLDGYSQPGASPNTLATGDNAVLAIELNGAGARAGATGLSVAAGGTTIRGLAIDGFSQDGIDLSGSGADGDVIEGNFIGTNPAGTADASNAGFGISLFGATNNTIGGTTPDARNLISGNKLGGVQLNQQSSGNAIEGNYIGTDVTGTAALDNIGPGVSLVGATNNIIGGTAAGASNLITGNTGGGVSVSQGSSGNVVLGNFIGTDVTGTVALGNGSGVTLSGAINNTIGGTTQAARNVISGNAFGGVQLGSLNNGNATQASSGNVVEGNYIGTDAAGTHSLGNGGGGVSLSGATNNTIGGTAAGAENLISGNLGPGVALSQGASGNVVLGNFIGTDIAGTAALDNGGGGVAIADATNNTIGGTVAGAANVISGNALAGVLLTEVSAVLAPSGNVVEGNLIGTDPTGTKALGNIGDGVALFGATNNTIGGAAAGAGNLISGNIHAGVDLGSGSSGNEVLGNFIGTDAAGTAALDNGGGGVAILGATGNAIGGTAAGASNLISGNAGGGVSISGGSSNDVLGNFIGTDVTGTVALGNTGPGVSLLGTTDNTLGGTAAGAGNLISGNGGAGVDVGAGSSGNVLVGNFIGTDVTGTAALGNLGDGVDVSGSGNLIGGTLAGNAGGGIQIRTVRTIPQGAFQTSGGASEGNPDIRLQRPPVNIFRLAGVSNVVGGLAGGGNLISGNAGFGVRVFAPKAASSSTSTASGNDVSSPTSTGAASAGQNVVEGNLIGTDLNGTKAVANGLNGVQVEDAGNTIGGTNAGAGNAIAFNRIGVAVVGSAATGNSILGNAIFANSGLGIDLGADGVTLNDSAGHNGPNNFQNFPLLTQVTASGSQRTVVGHLDSTPNATFRIEFFANAAYDPSGFGQGEVFLGFVNVTTDAAGFASFSFTYTGDSAHPFLTSTATDAAGNTSEFSGRDRPPVNSVPASLTTSENVPVTVTISVNDPDNAATDTLQVTLMIGHGTLTMPANAGLTESGNGTSTLTCTGSIADLNAALAGLSSTPAANFDGADTLTLTTSDLAAAELGGPGVTSSSVPVTVVDVVNAPHLTVSDVAGIVGQAIPLDIRASTIDTDGSESLSIQISGVPVTATLSAGTNQGQGVWTLTVDQLNDLTLTASAAFTATLTVTATTTQVATGATKTTTGTFVVTVANVPTTAVLSSPPPAASAPSTPLVAPVVSAPVAPAPVAPAPVAPAPVAPAPVAPAPVAPAPVAPAPVASVVELPTTAVLSTPSPLGTAPAVPSPVLVFVTVFGLTPALAATPGPAVPVRAPITVGGGPTPASASNTTLLSSLAVPQSELSSFSDASGHLTPSATGVLLAQARTPTQLATLRAEEGLPGPEADSLLLATQVVSASLDGDDGVQLVEALLRGREERVANRRAAPRNEVSPDLAATPGPSAEAPLPILAAAEHESPALVRTLKWLAVPAALALLAGGWCWCRRGHKRSTPTQKETVQ